MLTSRYECKYFVRPQTLDRMREYLQPFVRPDAYAARSPDHRYTISSLYLDSADLRLAQMTLEGDKARFKLRLRRYADGPDQPVFAEIKKRLDAIVLKSRARLSAKQTEDLLASIAPTGVRPAESAEPLDAAAGEFKTRALAVSAQPIVRVKYQREAYEAANGDPVRVTFDTELVHAVSTDGSTAVGDGDWHETPLEGSIVEIKFTDSYPHWIRSLIDSLQLQKISIPKYVLCVQEAVRRGSYRAGGMVLTSGSIPELPQLSGGEPWNR